MVQRNKVKAIRLLTTAQKESRNAESYGRSHSSYKTWLRNTKLDIQSMFGGESEYMKDFDAAVSKIEQSKDSGSYRDGWESMRSLFDSMIHDVEEYWEDEHQEPKPPSVRENRPLDTKEVFIVHGRDDAAKETVARFLDRLGLSPAILHEQSNQGRTIIEKFEHHAQVGFAIALLTPDDVGALQEDASNLKPRARQNVIFEFGYFIGHLGRESVFALTKGDIEIPSDYKGVIYIPMDDAKDWRLDLIQEFKNAGLNVDANRAFPTPDVV